MAIEIPRGWGEARCRMPKLSRASLEVRGRSRAGRGGPSRGKRYLCPKRRWAKDSERGNSIHASVERGEHSQSWRLCRQREGRAMQSTPRSEPRLCSRGRASDSSRAFRHLSHEPWRGVSLRRRRRHALASVPARVRGERELAEQLRVRRRCWPQDRERRSPRKNILDLPDATALGHKITEPRDEPRRIDLEVAVRELELNNFDGLGDHRDRPRL